MLANDLGLDPCTVHTGLLASRYIGETEKNLHAVFDAAERESLLLVFDEADNLFAKRSEIRDAHVRYANVEVGYLMSRLERLRAPSIVTSCRAERIGLDILRRCHFIVEFALPDAAERAKLWRLHLPARASIDDDIDTNSFARKFEPTGGQIRTAVLRAAFLAAGESTSVSNQAFRPGD